MSLENYTHGLRGNSNCLSSPEKIIRHNLTEAQRDLCSFTCSKNRPNSRLSPPRIIFLHFPDVSTSCGLQRCRRRTVFMWVFPLLSLSFLFCFQQYVLAVGSSVFHAMFYGELAENKDEIHIPDVEPAAFLAMLK